MNQLIWLPETLQPNIFFLNSDTDNLVITENTVTKCLTRNHKV